MTKCRFQEEELAMAWQRIQTEINGRVGVITINYPPANALGYQTMKELEILRLSNANLLRIQRACVNSS